MAAVTVATPLAPAFGEDAAHKTLTNHYTNANLIPHLVKFCSDDVIESEHKMLLENPDLVVRKELRSLLDDNSFSFSRTSFLTFFLASIWLLRLLFILYIYL